MNLTRSSLKVFTAKATGTLIGLLGITFFARELGPQQIGVFFLFQALLGIFGIPADLGIGGAVTKRISEGKPADEIFSTALLLKLVPLTLVVTGILLFRDLINTYLGAELAMFLVAALVLQSFAGLAIQALRGELRVGETALPSLSRQIVYVGIGAMLVVLGVGALALVYGLLAGLIVMMVWGHSRSSVSIGRPSLAHARSLFDYSKYAFISSVGGSFYNWMDVAIIGFFLTQSHVGVYEVAWRITTIVMLLSRAIAGTIFPQVSQWHAEDATKRIEELLPKAIAPSLFLVIPAFFGTVLLSRDILGLVFGKEYITGWLVLIILMGEKTIHSVHVILGRSLQAINRPDLAARAGIIAMLLNLVLNVILIWKFGIVGAAVATAVSFIANSLLHAYYLSRTISIQLPYRQIGGSILASTGMTVFIWAVQSIIAINTLPQLFVIVALGAVVYGICALSFQSLRTVITDATRQLVT
jgi:O-antigen/teichoic acid export membrane protein